MIYDLDQYSLHYPLSCAGHTLNQNIKRSSLHCHNYWLLLKQVYKFIHYIKLKVQLMLRAYHSSTNYWQPKSLSLLTGFVVASLSLMLSSMPSRCLATRRGGYAITCLSMVESSLLIVSSIVSVGLVVLEYWCLLGFIGEHVKWYFRIM